MAEYGNGYHSIELFAKSLSLNKCSRGIKLDNVPTTRRDMPLYRVRVEYDSDIDAKNEFEAEAVAIEEMMSGRMSVDLVEEEEKE